MGVVRNPTLPCWKRHADWLLHSPLVFPPLLLFRLNGWLWLFLAWAFACGTIWPGQDTFASTQVMYPPFLNTQFDENEEVSDASIVSLSVPFLGNGKGLEPRVEEVFQDPVFADLYFDEGRSVLQGGIEKFLQETVVLLKQEEKWKLRIEGHCDSRGTAAYNFALADYHLMTLTTYFQVMGIQSERIHLVNFGQDPLACQGTGERCQEDNLRAKEIFSILAVGQSQQGCLARLRLVTGKDVDQALHHFTRSPYLQRIHLASPHSSSF